MGILGLHFTDQSQLFTYRVIFLFSFEMYCYFFFSKELCSIVHKAFRFSSTVSKVVVDLPIFHDFGTAGQSVQEVGYEEQ